MVHPLALAPAWKAAAVALAVLLGLGYTPASVYTATATGTALSAVTGYVWTTVKLPPVTPNTLKAAILNVTTDFDEVRGGGGAGGGGARRLARRAAAGVGYCALPSARLLPPALLVQT